MKLRTLTLLQDFVDADLAWRKRELVTSGFSVKRAKGDERAYACRAALCLTYAHWEGFIKAATTAYLNFVSLQGLQYRSLAPPLLALCLRGRLVGLEATNRVAQHSELVGFLLSEMREDASIPWNEAVEGLSNLNWATFADVATIIGLDVAAYAPYGMRIDASLVKNRHKIAHGLRTDIDQTTVEELQALIIQLLDNFRTDIENAATNNSHLRTG